MRWRNEHEMSRSFSHILSEDTTNKMQPQFNPCHESTGSYDMTIINENLLNISGNGWKLLCKALFIRPMRGGFFPSRSLVAATKNVPAQAAVMKAPC
ncbi:hypothetical protein [Saccharibacter floricola]|uniref:hypothetical protein n=1 Tax=Saccharibacter floricola TaxID=231053 RepID=UPI00146EB16B|nr:hypothetical protein [Saccharibacter floricola]